MSSTLDSWERHVNHRLGAGMVAFNRRVGEVRWAGWRSASLGEGQRTALLLHGTGGARHSWGPMLERLDPAIAILAPDLPGHGLTRCAQHSRHGLEDMARDLAGLVAAEGIDRIDLIVGHSAGAAVALHMALAPSNAFSIGAILGITPSLVPPPSLYTLLLGPMLAPLVGSEPSAGLAALLARSTGMVDRLLASTGSTIDPWQRQSYRLLLGDTEHMRGAIGFMAATDLPTLLDRLKDLKVTCDMIIAEDDPWIPAPALADIIARHLPQAGLERWEGGHMLPESNPQRVANAIASRIARARAKGMGT